MSGFSRGGYIPTPGLPVTLADSECLLNRNLRCVRQDKAHLNELIDVSTVSDSQPVHVPGRCLHRACHVVPVESAVDGTVVARLCTACDMQLP